MLKTREALRSAGDHEVHGLRAFAFFVRFDIEVDTLTFVERCHSGALDRRDVDEHVAAAVVGLDETVAALAVEELDDSTLRHREAPSQLLPAPTARQLGRTSTRTRKASAPRSHFRRPPKEAERQSQHVRVDNNRPCWKEAPRRPQIPFRP